MVFVGVNGCKAGWLAVSLGDYAPAYKVASEFQAIASAYPSALILVDVPIGLLSSGPNERPCDQEARRVLGRARASSVFPAPCRSAIWKPTYESASRENFSQTGRNLSKQSWAIVPRIRQLEEYLKRYSGQGPVVREIHPEVCFWALAGRPMAHNKHEEAGRMERLGVLDARFSAAREFVEHVSRTERRSVLGTDDVVDAFVGALTGLLAGDSLRTLPASPEVDKHGLRMEMVYAGAGTRSQI